MTTTTEINYYSFDLIVQDDDGTLWGYIDTENKFCEVYPLTVDDTEQDLIENGFAKCDAPNWDETMLVEESAWSELKQ